MLDKQLQEQNEKVASKDDFPINWIDRVSLFLSHTIKYLIPVIVLVMMYEIFMRYIMEKPTMWVNELCLWLAGICYLVGGIYATRLRSHIRIVLLYDWVSRPTQRIFDLISTISYCSFCSSCNLWWYGRCVQIIYKLGEICNFLGSTYSCYYEATHTYMCISYCSSICK